MLEAILMDLAIELVVDCVLGAVIADAELGILEPFVSEGVKELAKKIYKNRKG
jgi:hypothetical protein